MPEKYLMKTIKVAPSLQICMRILFVNMLYAVIVMLLLSYSDKVFKGTDRLCKVFKLSVYSVAEFECLVDVQNHKFGWVCFEKRNFKTIK